MKRERASNRLRSVLPSRLTCSLHRRHNSLQRTVPIKLRKDRNYLKQKTTPNVGKSSDTMILCRTRAIPIIVHFFHLFSFSSSFEYVSAFVECAHHVFECPSCDEVARVIRLNKTLHSPTCAVCRRKRVLQLESQVSR